MLHPHPRAAVEPNDPFFRPGRIFEAENDSRDNDANPLVDAIVAPKKYVIFTSKERPGEHDAAGAASHFYHRVVDWLDDTLAGFS